MSANAGLRPVGYYSKRVADVCLHCKADKCLNSNEGCREYREAVKAARDEVEKPWKKMGISQKAYYLRYLETPGERTKRLEDARKRYQDKKREREAAAV